jgi:malonate decarboxylase delta subunit
MEHLEFVLPGGARRCRAGQWTLTGVVASGNLEILIEAGEDTSCRIIVETSVAGFADTWRDVLEQGVARHGIGGVRISINDGGATPAVVGLRLDQAILDSLEASQ